MTKLEPRIDFAHLDEGDIATYGLNAAQNAFDEDVLNGLTNGDSLAIVVGVVDDGVWHQLGSRCFGPDAADFAVNVDAETGKLATALIYGLDSIEANYQCGGRIPEGPQRFTGGVYYSALAHTVSNGWMTRDFAGAASGVQGHVDMSTVYTALTRMGALWALKMVALHGKAS